MSPLPRRTPVLRPSLRTSLRTLFVTTLSVAVASVALSAPAHAENRVTPGDFTGYGFDQCLAPTQAKMDAWMEYSPFSAVGIYISGASRACRSQPNLTTTWISTQLAQGLAAAADHARPAELVRRPVPAVRRLDRPDDQGELDQLVRRGAQPGHRGGEVGGRRGEGSRHHRRQHALVRPRGLVERQRRLVPRVGAVVPAGLDQGAAPTSATSRASTPAPAPAWSSSTTPARTGPTTCSPTGSGSPAGTASPTPPRPTSVTTAGAPAAG